MASVLNESTREWIDEKSRIWWEEFIVICETNNESEALDVAEKIRKTIETWVIKKINEKGTSSVIKKTPVTVSLGLDKISVTWWKKSSKQELLEEAIRVKWNADKALYFSKNNWKNKVTLYTEELDR